MAPAALESSASAPAVDKPVLLVFYSPRSGICRRVEPLLAQVLQRNHNHETFDVRRVCAESRSDLLERFRVRELPTFLVIEGRKIRRRLAVPKTTRELEQFLAPWLR